MHHLHGNQLAALHARAQAFQVGHIDARQKLKADEMVQQTVAAIRAKQWIQAVTLRSAVNEFIADCNGGRNPYDFRSAERLDSISLSAGCSQTGGRLRFQLHWQVPKPARCPKCARFARGQL